MPKKINIFRLKIHKGAGISKPLKPFQIKVLHIKKMIWKF